MQYLQDRFFSVLPLLTLHIKHNALVLFPHGRISILISTILSKYITSTLNHTRHRFFKTLYIYSICPYLGMGNMEKGLGKIRTLGRETPKHFARKESYKNFRFRGNLSFYTYVGATDCRTKQFLGYTLESISACKRNDFRECRKISRGKQRL